MEPLQDVRTWHNDVISVHVGIACDHTLKYFMKLECPRVLSRRKLLPECSVGNLKWRQLKMKHTWQLTCGLYTYRPSTAGCSQWQFMDGSQGKGFAYKWYINTTDSAYDLSVNLSPWMCSHNSCPGWRSDGNLLAYVIPIATSGVDLATYTSSTLAYSRQSMTNHSRQSMTNLAVCHEK